MSSRLGFGLFLLTMAACGSASIDRSDFTTNVCAQGSWAELSGVTLADSAMYLAHVVDFGAGVARPQITSSVGTPCVAAPDVVACKAAIAAAKPLGQAWHSEQCGGVGCTTTRTFFVAEKAGVVTVIESFDALRAVIAPTDGAAEAVLLAVHLVPQQADYGRGVDCTQPQAKAVANGGWEVFLASGDGGCTDRVERRLLVAKDGATNVIEATTRKASESCIYP